MLHAYTHFFTENFTSLSLSLSLKFILLGSTTAKKYIIFVKKSMTHLVFLWVPHNI